MRCPTCGEGSRVKATRESMRAFTTVRARECPNGHRFATYEVTEANAPKHPLTKRVFRPARA